MRIAYGYLDDEIEILILYISTMWSPHIGDNFIYKENGARALPNTDKNEEVNHAFTTVILVFLSEQH